MRHQHSSAPSIEKEIFVCIDCETTGLDLEKDQIIEVGLMQFTFHETHQEYNSLIDPKVPIPESSTQIHKITDEMIVGKPTIDKELPQILRLIGKHPIVGHGVHFDIAMIVAAAKRAGIPTTIEKNRVIDTLRMARLYGESASNSLQSLREHFSIEPEGAHRAMSDVIVNIEVFKFLCKQYKNLPQLLQVLSKPISMKTMPLGKHKGRAFREIPLNYLYWASNKDFDQDLLFSIRSEIQRRKKGNLFSQAGNPFQDLGRH